MSRHVVTVVPLGAAGPLAPAMFRPECACGWKGEPRTQKDKARVEAAAHTRAMKAIGE